jgi:Flp pilus assembly protein TadG
MAGCVRAWIRRWIGARLGRDLEALRSDERGMTAIEFGMVGLPFFMMLFGIIAVGLFFFTTFTLENAVEDAARLIRTGQVQQSGMSAEQFKQEVCSRTPPYMDCEGKIRVNVQSFTGFGSVVVPSCVDNGGNLVPASGVTYDPGAESTVVLVTVCYEWELAGKLPFLHLGNMSNGSALIQASTTFRSEPYNK